MPSNPFQDIFTELDQGFKDMAKRLDAIDAKVQGLYEGQRTKDLANGSPYLTRKEAACLLRCSTSTIDNYRREGKLPPARLGGNEGRKVLFLRDDVLKLKEL